MNVIAAVPFIPEKLDRTNMSNSAQDLQALFINQNLVTYDDNFKFRGDLPLFPYFDFETTASGILAFDPNNNEMYPVSLVIIFIDSPKTEF